MQSPATEKEQPLTAVQADWGAEKDLEVFIGSKLNVRRLTASWAVLTGTQPVDQGERIIFPLLSTC